ncbi:hypothetical protein Scep_006797 [Stephania cephalantha]|uniref:Uncharacterized protein n=1 Tax=Stephania cephalantha TaxID=152367 RepID=A0AAP0K9V4_9MAGN
MEPIWGRDLGSDGVEGRVEFVRSGELKEGRVELICSLGELKEGRCLLFMLLENHHSLNMKRTTMKFIRISSMTIDENITLKKNLKLKAKLQRRRQELTQTTLDQPVDDEAVYYKVAGECPKGRVYSLMSLGRKKRRYVDPDTSTSQLPQGVVGGGAGDGAERKRRPWRRSSQLRREQHGGGEPIGWWDGRRRRLLADAWTTADVDGQRDAEDSTQARSSDSNKGRPVERNPKIETKKQGFWSFKFGDLRSLEWLLHQSKVISGGNLVIGDSAEQTGDYLSGHEVRVERKWVGINGHRVNESGWGVMSLVGMATGEDVVGVNMGKGGEWCGRQVGRKVKVGREAPMDGKKRTSR